MSVVSATSFHSLCQLWWVRCSLDTESTATLVHAFVKSRLDYCNILLAGSPKTVIDKLQRVMNAAARIVSGTPHTEVRPRSDTAPSRWAALARCGRSDHVQARLDGIQVSSRPSARLLVWAVHAGRSSRWTTASPFSQPQLAPRPKVPAEHVWSSCLCRGYASNLELAVGWTAKSGSPQCHLLTQLKDVSVSTITGALSALEVLCDYALYKSTFTLHISVL